MNVINNIAEFIINFNKLLVYQKIYIEIIDKNKEI